ncbi:SDR family oxidoreductase [Clostridium sp. YIM B02551]|uniref:SDR family oxidoreductase n=1 Tax=Clostridium sp. YIM B02551 TaxID=2910679 RepID=UPI001EEA455E|nr:SDR family oxidoreductase [Clostridium sp. YIM B02551]
MPSPYNPFNLPNSFPPQHQAFQPGVEAIMSPKPISETPLKNPMNNKKLLNKVALITGGDSGIGRAAAYAFAKEGADIAIIYLNEHMDAQETKNKIELIGRKCIIMPIDISIEENSKLIINEVIKHFGKLDILVNNAGVIYPTNNLEDVSAAQLEYTFRVNVFSYFYLTKEALPYLNAGSSIINTSSIAAFKPYPIAPDYQASKAAITAFTKSMALILMPRGIRVNSVAPGEVWSPLIPSAFDPYAVATWGQSSPIGRAGQPFEIAQAFVFLASDDSSYMSGQTLNMYN